MAKIINKNLTYDLDDKILVKFRRRSYYLRNKINFELEIKKRRRKDSFYVWDSIPYSFLIFAPSVKNFHHMVNNLYFLNNGILSRKQRFFYKKQYYLKNYTAYYTYRLYMEDVFNFFTILDLILDYDIIIVGLEVEDKIYSIEYMVDIFSDLKTDVKFFLNVINFDFSYLYNEYCNNLNTQCQLLIN